MLPRLPCANSEWSLVLVSWIFYETYANTLPAILGLISVYAARPSLLRLHFPIPLSLFQVMISFVLFLSLPARLFSKQGKHCPIHYWRPILLLILQPYLITIYWNFDAMSFLCPDITSRMVVLPIVRYLPLEAFGFKWECSITMQKFGNTCQNLMAKPWSFNVQKHKHRIKHFIVSSTNWQWGLQIDTIFIRWLTKEKKNHYV